MSLKIVYVIVEVVSDQPEFWLLAGLMLLRIELLGYCLKDFLRNDRIVPNVKLIRPRVLNYVCITRPSALFDLWV